MISIRRRSPWARQREMETLDEGPLRTGPTGFNLTTLGFLPTVTVNRYGTYSCIFWNSHFYPRINIT